MTDQTSAPGTTALVDDTLTCDTIKSSRITGRAGGRARRSRGCRRTAADHSRRVAQQNGVKLHHKAHYQQNRAEGDAHKVLTVIGPVAKHHRNETGGEQGQPNPHHAVVFRAKSKLLHGGNAGF